ncbi:tripartite tricarboxylate transporter substrate binding protein [Pusillimonas sp. TS35]|uniref:Bug family tripartite tricarboxylate transporter substrate binding protein n=1 Tax=Paracandidimonas lactea TaxID=2895524 RepID=UPI0013719A73|nr:tripartite tricarboxylate transporter substrate binding protein [Paracandidimonas lactea]MYN14324.1 tripartite tricarboxylate transporter substrate binding protein [Pusillimonas sp. TS35]
MKFGRIAAAGALLASLTAHTYAAQTWPAQPVTIVVPYTAGGGTDSVARLLSEKLSQRWNQTVVVSNKDGASGTIGASYVAHAQPDGYTIMLSATAEVVISQHIMPKMPYSPEKDLRPVTLAVKLPFMLVTHPDKPYKTTAELIDYAKAHPGAVSYASSGNGTPQHLAGALFEQLSGTSLLHVPYKGVAPSISALLANQIDIGFVGLPIGYSHVQSGKLRPLAVSAKDRSPAVPDVPAVDETKGMEAFDLTQWFGVFVPAGTPDAVVGKIQEDIHAVLQLPDLRAKLQNQGAEPSGMPTADFEQFVKAEREKFGRIVKSMKL